MSTYIIKDETEDKKLITTEEYMNKKEQEELDKYFDEYYKLENERIRKEQEKLDLQERKYEYIQIIGDCEDEISILESLLKIKIFGSIKQQEKIKEKPEDIKKDITTLKRKLNKTKTNLNNLFKEEDNMKFKVGE